MIRFRIAMGFLWVLLALVLHLIPGAVGPAHARPGGQPQGSRKDDIVFNSRGIPLAGATVRVCAMPASGQPTLLVIEFAPRCGNGVPGSTP